MVDLLEQIHETLSNYHNYLLQIGDEDEAYDIKAIMMEVEDEIDKLNSVDN